MKTIVSERGQITLSEANRASLGIRPGIELELTVQEGKIIGTKVAADDPLQAWRGRGKLPAGFTGTDDYLRRIRD